MRLELVVVRPRLVHRAERERASRHVDLGRSARCAIRRRSTRRPDTREPVRDCSASSIDSCDWSSFWRTRPKTNPRRTRTSGASRSMRSSMSSDALAHVRGVRADGRRIRGRELRAVRPLAAERVVDVVVDVRDRARPSDGAKDPELLEAGDVRVAPRERRDAGRDLRDESSSSETGASSSVCRGARALERTLDLEARLHTSHCGRQTGCWQRAERGNSR